jgi:hypothetical protein
VATTTYRGSIVAGKIKDFLESQKDQLGVQQVFYGDQQRIPQSPVVCVEPAIVDRPLTGTSYTTTNSFTISIIVYHTSMDGIEKILRVTDEITERVADALNLESTAPNFGGGTQLDGKVISGHVVRLEHGYRTLNDRLMRANRLVWEGITKTPLFKEEVDLDD